MHDELTLSLTQLRERSPEHEVAPTLQCAGNRRARLQVGTTEVTGYAFAGDHRNVVRMDVSLDAGQAWTLARPDPPEGPWTWRHWHSTVDLPEGEVTITTPRLGLHRCHATRVTGCAVPQGHANNSWAQVRVSCRA